MDQPHHQQPNQQYWRSQILGLPWKDYRIISSSSSTCFRKIWPERRLLGIRCLHCWLLSKFAFRVYILAWLTLLDWRKHHHSPAMEFLHQTSCTHRWLLHYAQLLYCCLGGSVFLESFGIGFLLTWRNDFGGATVAGRFLCQTQTALFYSRSS